MKAIYDTTYLISSEDLTQLKADLKSYGAAFKQVQGRYKGQDETSLVVLGISDKSIQGLLQKHNQESALKLDGTRGAELLFQDGTRKAIGQWKPVDAIRAQNCEAFTFDPNTNQFFIVEN